MELASEYATIKEGATKKFKMIEMKSMFKRNMLKIINY